MTDSMSPWEFDRRPPKVIAIGSQLVFGSVGNNAAAAQFDAAGLRRLTVPTVLLSNLPHYPSVHAVDIPDAWLANALSDLVARGLLGTVRFITIGFLASPSQAVVIADWLRGVKDAYPKITVILDPTMGDDDVGIYTAPGLAQAHLQLLIPLATGIVPNRFELKLLAQAAGWPDEPLDVIATAQKITKLGPNWAVVTSATGNLDLDTVVDSVVTTAGASSHGHPMVATAAKGAGDHFAAALLIALAQGKTVDEGTEVAAQAVADHLQSTKE